MIRPTHTINLPISGLEVSLITYWSWGEKQELIKTVLGDTTVDPLAKSVNDMRATNTIDYNFKALELAVQKIVDKEGKEVSVKELKDFPEKDVQLLMDYLNGLDEGLKKN